jgi:hypothetical protein
MEESNKPGFILDDMSNILAIIIYADQEFKGIKFISPANFALQIGTMHRPKGDLVAAHIHKQQIRTVEGTQEVLIVKSGKMLVELFDDKKKFVQSVLLEKGDIILLAFGGHSIKMMENVDLIEVKQGPYSQILDKDYI